MEPLSDKNMEVADEPVESKEVPPKRVTNPFVVNFSLKTILWALQWPSSFLFFLGGGLN